MFSLLRRRLWSAINLVSTDSLQTQFLIRPISSTTTENCSSQDQSSSFTFSYLVNSCGLSPKSALSASNRVRFTSPSKPDLVLRTFRNHGFSDTQIAKLVSKCPVILSACPEKTLLPKFNFLHELGFSDSETAHFLSQQPNFLRRSLERSIKPSCDYLQSLLGSNGGLAAAIKSSCSTWIFQFDIERIVAPKVEILRKYGVTEENIVKLVAGMTRLLGNNDDRFEELVRIVSEMGFDPSSTMFVHAIDVFSGMKRDTLEAKLQLFCDHGWSEDEIASAIRKQPFCVSISEEKLKKGLDFFMNKLKWRSSELVKYPNLLGLSLEKRIIPRWMVIQCLLSKRLTSDRVSFVSVLKLTEANFIERFLIKFENEAPEILKLYQGKL